MWLPIWEHVLKVVPAPGDTDMMPPQMDEVAQILYKIVEKDCLRRLVITSAALRAEDVTACFGAAAGFDSCDLRCWSIERRVVAPWSSRMSYRSARS